jgi:glycosyltransferase involved in cell wall biosynthesis
MNWAAPASLASDPLLRPCPWAARAAVTCQPTPGTPLPLSILAVHQGFELYGSDRVFLQTLDALRERHPNASLTIVLPRDGALADVVRKRFGSVTIDEELAVLRRRELRQLGLRWLVRLSRGIRRAIKRMRQHDLCLINTVTVADYLIASRFSRTPTVVHVHELVTGLERPFYSVLLTFANVAFVFISGAVQRSFLVPPWRRAQIVHNGVPIVASDTERAPLLPTQVRAEDPVRLLVIGRISHRKGQRLVLEALARLPAHLQDRWHLRIVGDVYGDDVAPRSELLEVIERNRWHDKVDLAPFTPDPSPHYAWAQLVIVPSSRPEPFGLTAVEAMAHGRAVIGADHGGLIEIVRDGETGRLFRPNDADALAHALEEYLGEPMMIRQHGVAARQRHQRCFAEATYRRNITSFLDQSLRTPLREDARQS